MNSTVTFTSPLSPTHSLHFSPSALKTGEDDSDWLRNQLSAMTHLVSNRHLANPSDPLWNAKSQVAKLHYVIKELRSFYQSWHGRRMPSISHLQEQFSPLFKDIFSSFSSIPDEQFFNPLQQLLLAKAFGAPEQKHDRSMKRLASFALSELAQIDPTVKRATLLFDRLKRTGPNDKQEAKKSFILNLNALISPSRAALFHLPLRPHAKTPQKDLVETFFPSNAPKILSLHEAEIPFWTLHDVSTVYGSSTLSQSSQEVASCEGYTSTLDTTKIDWPSDLCMHLPGEQTVYPRQVQDDDQWYEIYRALVLNDGRSTASLSKHPHHNEAYLSDYSSTQDSYLNTLKHLFSAKELRCYLEGGNILRSVKADGTPVYIHGAHNVLATWLTQRDIYHRPELHTEPWQKQLRTDKKILLQSLKKDEKASGLEPENNPNHLNELHIIAELNLARQTIKGDLGGEHIFLLDGGGLDLPQLGSQLSMTMASLPNQQILIHDHTVSATLLNSLIDSGQLTDEESALFEQYRDSAIKLADLESPLVNAMEAQLKEAGFTVHRVPGAYYRHGKQDINYINGLYHLGKNQELVAETFGFPQAGELYLREAYVHFLENAGVKRTYFHGRRTLDHNVSAGGTHPYNTAYHQIDREGGWGSSIRACYQSDVKSFYQVKNPNTD